MLWFHGRRHIEQIDVRLLNRTQDRNDVSTCNSVQMWSRNRYANMITVKSNMTGRLWLPWQPIQNFQSMIMCVMLPHTLVPSMTAMGCLTSIKDVSVFSKSEALCYHGNKCVTANIFRNQTYIVTSYVNGIGTIDIWQIHVQLCKKIKLNSKKTNKKQNKTKQKTKQTNKRNPKTLSHLKCTLLNKMTLLFRFKFKIFLFYKTFFLFLFLFFIDKLRVNIFNFYISNIKAFLTVNVLYYI